MKKTSLRMKILSGMLCTGLALSSTSISFAAVRDSGNLNEKLATSMDFKVTVDKEKTEQVRHAEMKGTLEDVIKESVQLNVITADEGKRILDHVATKSDKRSGDDNECKNCKGNKGGLFNELVTEKILTQEKSDALKEKMHLKKTEIRAEELQNSLNILVVNKVLTPDQKEKVKKAIMTNDAKRKENYLKMKDMNEKEKKAYNKLVPIDWTLRKKVFEL
ncbi:hypothetical protein [Clostridium sp.]|uniref:hypothetical protein n=1 Tax=Clostridium sp. TaxID=1506 RepID=UPI001A56754F|nr:hypothetical protein [Clostridium sp.]MBK5243237.1 hypothetical protein [Clostridium sp.]